jgi:glycosyltransferase involved in cell wall biosynthesis
MEMLSVLQRHPTWQLYLAGSGGGEEEILALAHQMANIFWCGIVAYDRAIYINSLADVLFAIYDPDIANHRFSSPNKIFEAMMLAKPLIVARNTNMDQIVLQENMGVVVSYGDVDELERALLFLQEHPRERQQFGLNGRHAYERSYRWDIMESRLLAAYNDLVG